MPFSVENGLMTTNGKFRRDAIAARFAGEVAQLYKKKPTWTTADLSQLPINADKCPSRAETRTEPDPLVIELIRPDS